jgi:SAM-dependent methyltransferase
VHRWLEAPADVHYDATYFEEFAAIAPHHFWFVSRNALLVWAVGRYAGDARSMLEVGAGTGQVLAALRRAYPRLALAGTEALVEGLRIAAAAVPDAELVQADARQLPFEAEFDAVGAFDVLEHVREHETALAQIVRAVRPGGTVLLTVPQHDFLWSAMDDYAGHSRRYSRASLTALLAGQGLVVERMTSFVSLLLPWMWLSRRRQRRQASMADFHLPPALNAAGRGVMTAERALIRAGVPMPAGGSLLAVARRPAR